MVFNDALFVCSTRVYLGNGIQISNEIPTYGVRIRKLIILYGVIDPPLPPTATTILEGLPGNEDKH